MDDLSSRRKLMDEYRRLYGVRVKLDIARAIRSAPHLDPALGQKAFAELADTAKVDRLVRDLAYDETVAAVRRGETPAAALLLLAGFQPNPQGVG